MHGSRGEKTAVNSRNAASANLPENFRIIDTTRKTCIQETEEEGNLEEDEWVEEFRRQEALQEEEYLRENNDVGEIAEYIGETAEYIEETAEYSNDNINEWGV